ncbi:MAG TPA: carbon monoxide dehydrogenase, partial [Thermoanaerobaculia bacterium]|nr:carbon monoxide dehydrogenase [Thermoanaerobaculia bacterium]
MALIGKSVPRKEGREKVTGAARYVDDLRRDGMLYGTTVRSPVARGRIRGVHFGDGIPWEEIVVVTVKDVPGKNCITLILEDQPCLADGVVNHPEEPVLLLAHADRYLLEEARRSVTLEIDELPSVFDLEESLAATTVIWGED